ncbi:MAG TPA: hypothetical protein DHW71_07130 [Gammaproteobacteria bacterium]|nr:hypothetical protein [Gammaproteobacteria bacterium]HBF08696.1 hypothetical protein [Gammaproteobacteria bacterium]HCK92740.1 hypothetical protein [Gammaproteobacteria bacterium]|tara:strand:- start:47 stop:2320 length:2274 start_codon:yes stop_codon:yes gene_type:complete
MPFNICRGCQRLIQENDFVEEPNGGALHWICSTRSDHLSMRSVQLEAMNAPQASHRLNKLNRLSEDVQSYLTRFIDAAQTESDKQGRQDFATLLQEMDDVKISGKFLEVTGHLDLEGLSLTRLPAGLRVNGDLSIQDCDDLKILPTHLEVSDDLNISRCKSLLALSQTLMVGGGFYCSNNDVLTDFSKDTHISGSLFISRCKSFEQLPKIDVEGSVDIYICDSFKSIKEFDTFKSHLNITRCPVFSETPQALTVNGDCSLCDNPMLNKTPDIMNIKGALNLSRTAIKRLNADITLLSNLSVDGCNQLRSVDRPYSIPGDFIVSDCSRLRDLAEGIEIGGSLDLEDCITLGRLPNRLTMSNDLNLSGCDLIVELPDWVVHIADNASHGVMVDVSHTGLPAATLQQLEANTNPMLTFRTRNDFLVDEGLASITTQEGQEAQDLLQFLRQEPAAPFIVQYRNDYGIDQGGVSRQAFDRAIHQLIDSTPDLFEIHKGQFIFQTDKDKITHIPSASSVGLLLGRIAQLGMGIGTCFHDDFYKNLFHHYQCVNLIDDQELKSFFDEASALVSDGLPKSSYVALLIQHADHLYGSESAQAYLNAATENEVRDYALTTGLYMLAAGQMGRSGLTTGYESAAAFKTAIAGFDELKASLLRELRFTGSGDVKTLEKWCRQAIQDASATQLERLCREMSGASAVGISTSPVTIHLGSVSYPNLMFEAHSCGYQLDVNSGLFKQVVDNNNYEGFKNGLLNSFTKSFNIG